MTDLLDTTIAEWRRTRFVWGEADCLLSVGDYVKSARPDCLDISARFRGTYDDEAGAMAHVEAADGPEGLLDLFGLERTDNPVRGDICVVWTGDADVGALCTGDTFVMRLERGTVEVNRRFLELTAAWKV